MNIISNIDRKKDERSLAKFLVLLNVALMGVFVWACMIQY